MGALTAFVSAEKSGQIMFECLEIVEFKNNYLYINDF